jgi:hypothetical protein
MRTLSRESAAGSPASDSGGPASDVAAQALTVAAQALTVAGARPLTLEFRQVAAVSEATSE